VEEYIQDTVTRDQDRYSETELARALGIGRKALWTRRRQWGLARNVRTPRRG
jgi:DNA-binding NtrC family response regulator